jgi:hypothetical protein
LISVLGRRAEDLGEVLGAEVDEAGRGVARAAMPSGLPSSTKSILVFLLLRSTTDYAIPLSPLLA